MICPDCGQSYRQGQWPWCCGSGDHGRPHGRQGGSIHPRERSVVYRDPRTGRVAYPPRNDQPMPQVYAQAGYERVELNSLRAVEKLEREDNVRSEIAWFDQGSGHADYEPEQKPIDLTGIEFLPVKD